MTSTPVSVGTRNYFQGQMPTTVSSGGDTTNSFSEILKNQKSEQRTEQEKQPLSQEKQARQVADAKPQSSREVVRKGSTETPSEEKVPVQDAVETAETKLLEETAEELEISMEELLEILGSLGLTPLALLQPENLQTLVLAAAGETDACSMVTDEGLFQTLQSLNALAEEVTAEIAQTTGKEPEEVQELLTQLTEENDESPATLGLQEQPAEEAGEEEPLQEVRRQPEAENGTAQQGTEPDGSQIMLERSMDGSARQGAEQPSGGDNQNMPLQVQTPQLPAQEAAQIGEAVPETYFDTDTELILQQITDYMRGQVTEGMSELEMQLHPESLGNLHVRLTAKEGALTAQFTAQNETVKAVLESQMIQLKETFREQGVTVEAIEVTVQSHRFDQQYSGGSGSAKEEERQPGRPARRRINLDLPSEEEMTEEEQLAAEMLRESGGTVDYSV